MYQLFQSIAVISPHGSKGHLHYLVDQHWEIGTLECLLQTHHLIEDAAQRPDVGLGIVVFPFTLLKWKVKVVHIYIYTCTKWAHSMQWRI